MAFFFLSQNSPRVLQLQLSKTGSASLQGTLVTRFSVTETFFPRNYVRVKRIV